MERSCPYRRPAITDEDLLAAARDVHRRFDERRSVRAFSNRPVPREVVAELIAAASTAPSGAHKQPWTFVAVSDPKLKRAIRLAAEEEERASYAGRMNEQWLADLAPLGTTWEKPYLEVAPWLVVLFEQAWAPGPEGRRLQHYYVKESVGIAAGMFVAAVHEAGLVTLTHTPSPMAFLSRILRRPAHERPSILFPLGHPSDDCQVPVIRRKSLDEVVVWDPREGD